ncbi:H-NS histone family protein [Burkholderia lata]|uniref:HNS-like protein n=1 Tax=Burkholderia lata (strain ATCC 17760 / DSM 23089 / LMG 22485 / NCIMB 9086 / R18194 / 383) TaxID=482957 RepID=A0A6P2WPT3_BURL3|nr:H-NS histone family protein [Burkholderia lata]VWC98634.1 HNS-like protein [Burkholderia lata]
MKDWPSTAERLKVESMVSDRYSELMKRYLSLQEEIAAVRRQEVGEVMSRIVRAMSIYGISLEDVREAARKQSKAGSRPKREPRYMDPDSGRTWTGKGRPPRWIIGKDVEQFLIRSGDAS